MGEVEASSLRVF
nr:unnamed protein product [Callosobruchus analis]